MKKLEILIAITLVFGLHACTMKKSSDKVPQEVLSSFEKNFPKAKYVDWEMENDSEWEAEFELDQKHYSANFTSEGEWLETEYEIETSEIPEEMKSILKANFAEYEIEEAEIAETSQGKSYEFGLETNGEKFEVSIDASGKLAKKPENDED